MNITYKIFGYAIIKAGVDEVLSLLNLCLENKLPYGRMKQTDDGVEFLFRLSSLGVLEYLCARSEITISVLERGGLPVWISKRKKRMGLWLGIICAMMLVIMSQSFLWRVEVVGNERMTTSEVLGFLKN